MRKSVEKITYKIMRVKLVIYHSGEQKNLKAYRKQSAALLVSTRLIKSKLGVAVINRTAGNKINDLNSSFINDNKKRGKKEGLVLDSVETNQIPFNFLCVVIIIITLFFYK